MEAEWSAHPPRRPPASLASDGFGSFEGIRMPTRIRLPHSLGARVFFPSPSFNYLCSYMRTQNKISLSFPRYGWFVACLALQFQAPKY